jgi:PII-like signaling protein
MTGYQVTFFTHQGRRHGRKTVHDWMLSVCEELGIRGVTTFVGIDSVGRKGHHPAHFFDLSDQPLEMVLALTPEQCDALLERLRAEQANLFYMKSEVEYGVIGGPPPAD